jgi:putative heme-binding domain-containing protein
LIAEFDAVFPSKIRELNSELAQMLVYLQAPNAAAKTMNLLKQAPTQEEQIDYARTLRHLHVGWSSELRKQYFEWFIKAARYRGGLCLARFVENIKEDVVATLSDAEKESLKQIIEAKPAEVSKPMYATPRDQVKLWTLPELVPIVEQGLVGRDFSRGRRMFGVAQCFACHRFDNQGGAMGPDLTGLSGRFNTRDLLESIVKPNKVISDQYAAVTITTNDGRVLTGRIINHFGDVMYVNTDMRNTGDHIEVKRGDIEEMLPAKTSMMPSGLLNTLKEDEILDLMAYLLSRGQRNHTMFKTSAAR